MEHEEDRDIPWPECTGMQCPSVAYADFLGDLRERDFDPYLREIERQELYIGYARKDSEFGATLARKRIVDAAIARIVFILRDALTYVPTTTIVEYNDRRAVSSRMDNKFYRDEEADAAAYAAMVSVEARPIDNLARELTNLAAIHYDVSEVRKSGVVYVPDITDPAVIRDIARDTLREDYCETRDSKARYGHAIHVIRQESMSLIGQLIMPTMKDMRTQGETR